VASRNKDGDDSGARGDDGRAVIAAARAEVVDILAGALFTLLLQGRFTPASTHDQPSAQSADGARNHRASLSELPCLVDQRPPSCSSTAARPSRRKEAAT